MFMIAGVKSPIHVQFQQAYERVCLLSVMVTFRTEHAAEPQTEVISRHSRKTWSLQSRTMLRPPRLGDDLIE
jgi:hypothetical protein